MPRSPEDLGLSDNGRAGLPIDLVLVERARVSSLFVTFIIIHMICASPKERKKYPAD